MKNEYLLNKFLLACIFIGIVMILIKEKEGFASHYHNIGELYKGPLLLDSVRKQKISTGNVPMRQNDSVRVGNYSQITNNVSLHPCNDKGYHPEICRAMYKPNDVVIGPRQKSCQPGFGCRRVGFYCSLID
mgnify:CR=1 FL=1|tara:strand:+ start:13004 stop:13396 length:393 start_codon:yes stop_codon:yes gene_type:complete